MSVAGFCISVLMVIVFIWAALYLGRLADDAREAGLLAQRSQDNKTDD